MLFTFWISYGLIWKLLKIYWMVSTKQETQEIIRGRNCRLSIETPKYHLGWAILAVSRLLDTLKHNIHYSFYVVKFFQPYMLNKGMYIRLNTLEMKSFWCINGRSLGWFKNPVSSQTDKLMAGTKVSDYLGLNHYKKAKRLKHFIHLRLAQGPQSLSTYDSISLII